MIKAERKNFNIRARRIIRSLHPCVSNTAKLVNLPDAPDVCTISFSEDFVQFVGKMLPQGVGPYNPAYISVTIERGHYVVWAAYVKNPQSFVKLWRSTEKPAWIPEISNGTSRPQDTPSRGIQAYRDYQARRTGS